MLVKCPRCESKALLSDRFDLVTCSGCGLKLTYRQYVDEIIAKDPAYSNIMNDYR